MYVGLVLVSHFVCLTVKDHLTYFFVVGRGGGRGLRFLSLHFLHFRVILIIFLSSTERGWWSNRRFGFVLFCVSCVYECSVLVFSFVFFHTGSQFDYNIIFGSILRFGISRVQRDSLKHLTHILFTTRLSVRLDHQERLAREMFCCLPARGRKSNNTSLPFFPFCVCRLPIAGSFASSALLPISGSAPAPTIAAPCHGVALARRVARSESPYFRFILQSSLD